MDALFEYIFYAGLVALAAGAIWFLICLVKGPRKRIWMPILLLIAGFGLMRAPVAISRNLSIDLGARETIVEGERTLGLTHWDGESYAFLEDKPDTVVLQMANADVTNGTLEFIKDMKDLRELDLNDSKITDDGLKIIAGLPSLERLRLRATAITDTGFKEHLMSHEKLRQLDLRETDVTAELVDEWKAAGEGRRAFVTPK